MSLPLTLPALTPAEYLFNERNFDFRHEYVDGIVFAMAGESRAHSTLCFNLNGILHPQLRGTPCRGFSPNMKVWAGAGLRSMYAYPDLAVACGEPLFQDEQGDVLLNPAVVFEVLSPSTEAYDRGEKFERYKSIETLTDYVLVSQDRPRVEHFRRRPDGEWARSVAEGPDALLALDSINCRLPLVELYERVTFGEQ
jgi:Uma2 family endonuclease